MLRFRKGMGRRTPEASLAEESYRNVNKQRASKSTLGVNPIQASGSIGGRGMTRAPIISDCFYLAFVSGCIMPNTFPSVSEQYAR